ncbi:nuclear pore complex protein Nup133-like [Branchiostoma floridae x Branchiostoma japonicum]
MFTPRSQATRPKFSPFTAGRVTRNTPSGRRSVGIFTPGKRSPFVGRSPAQNRSLNTSSILEETTGHVVQSYGSSLPVLVTEALTLADRDTDLSVHLSENGWAWLVCDRKLFIWRFKQGITKSTLCKELSLPPSDLVHSADLVSVQPSGDGHVVSVMAASAEGIVRYWPSLAHEGSCVEISAEVNGEECLCLTACQPQGYVLATVSGQLLLLTPASVAGQTTVNSRILQVPRGMFAGIGRRVSSLFAFGAQPTEATGGSTISRVVCGLQSSEDTRSLYILTENSLQKWEISYTGPDKILFECDLGEMLRSNAIQAIWGSSPDVAEVANRVQLWFLDMQQTRDGTVILASVSDPEATPAQMYFVLATLPTSGDSAPSRLSSFSLVNYSVKYQPQDQAAALNYHLLVPGARGKSAYIYTNNLVVFATVSGFPQPQDKVEFQSPGDRILGAGCCDGQALLFSNISGIVMVSMVDVHPSMDDSMAVEPSSRPESVLGGDMESKVEELSMSEDQAARLKGAFLHYCRRNEVQAQAIVDELFPPEDVLPTEPGSRLDRLVALLSQELIDDYPASDPRWAESVPHDAGSSSSSLILLHQLEDKQKAHDYLVTFLNTVGIWDRLTSVMVRDTFMPTRLLLCEHAEKLQAAITLRNQHSQYPSLVDAAIKRVLQQRGQAVPPSGLTPQDVFYREVSRIQDILEALVEYEEDAMAGDMSTRDMVNLMANVNTIMQAMLQAARKLRQSKNLVYQAHVDTGVKEPEYIPWTASSGSRGLRSLIKKQHEVTVEQGLLEATDVQTRGTFFQQLMELTDLLLDGYICQLESLGNGDLDQHYMDVKEKYEGDRAAYIRPLVDAGQHERAASLAEKYCDFSVLVQLCEDTDNQERLERYMVQFADKGFSDFLFKWYMDTGKRGKLLSQPSSQNAELAQFLASHEHLSWLHDINTSQWDKAHSTLKKLAEKETKYAARKKTLLSISKLAALASDQPQDSIQQQVGAINNELQLLFFQENLPADVMQTKGLEPDNMPVLAPHDLIQLYVGPENDRANEYDFNKALDLMQYIDEDDPAYEGLKLHIWGRALLRDDWSSISTDEPLFASSHTVFFKTVQLAFKNGVDLQEYLPDVDVLLSSEELGGLKDNSSFQYLVRAGYEHIQRVMTQE